MTKLWLTGNTLFFLLFISLSMHSQVVLQLEKRGRIKTTKFYPGDQLSIKLVGEKVWRTGNYVDGDPESDKIIFSFGEVRKSEIRFIRTPSQRTGGKRIGKMLTYFGAGVMLYTPVELIYQDDPNWPFIAFGASCFVGGLVLPKIIQPFMKTKIGGRKRLRVLDISPPSPLDYQK